MAHTGLKRFNCRVCGKPFRLASQLKTHQRTHRNKKSSKPPNEQQSSIEVKEEKDLIHSCQICRQSFASPEQLSRHSVTHSGTLMYRCTWCGKILTEHNHLNDHRKKCRQGSRVSDNIHSEKVNTNDLQDKCNENPNNFSHLNESTRKQQEMQSTGAGRSGSVDTVEVPVPVIKEEDFESEITTQESQMSEFSYGASLTSGLSLQDKKIVQNQNKRTLRWSNQQEGKARVKMPCRPQDVTTFPDSKVLTRGGASSVVDNSVHPDNSWCEPITMFECDKCMVGFDSEYNLEQHDCPAETTEECPRNYCNICYKFFAHPSKLQRHYVTHTGQRPFKCDICGKSFTQSVHARKHRTIHFRLKLHRMKY